MPAIKIPPRFLYYGLKVLGILGAVGTGLYTTFALMWATMTMRTGIIFVYLTAFAVVIISAELGLLNHPHFRRASRFITTCVGRAFFYVFIGGLLLDGYGWIVGIYLFTLGLLNLFFQCFLADRVRADFAAIGQDDPTAIGVKAYASASTEERGPNPYQAQVPAGGH